MTSYFDSAHEELRVARKLEPTNIWAMVQAFDALEVRVVFDCTVAAMLSDKFPVDLREAVHRVILKYGVRTLPCNAPPADFETEEQHWRRLNDLVWHLHTVFHEVAERLGPGYDHPTTWVRQVDARGEEERERMVAADPATAEHAAAWAARLKAEMEQP